MSRFGTEEEFDRMVAGDDGPGECHWWCPECEDFAINEFGPGQPLVCKCVRCGHEL